MKRKTVILVSGPTASGKTSAAITLARQYRTAIISADSRQCYKEMTIGVAKPSPEELDLVRHYFINSHSIQEEVNAAVFERYALQAAEEIFRENDVAVMAGGTGLYIKAFCEGLDNIPSIPPELRNQIIRDYELKGLEWLQQQVREKDMLYFKEGETRNPQRLMRALEVQLATGKSIREWQQKKTVTRGFDIVKFGMDIPKEQLHGNIYRRVDQMIQQGLVKEVMTLVPFRHLNALQTVGYTEIFDHLDGKFTLDEAVERIKINTRQYAKRQLTWFRKDPSIQWVKTASAIRI